MSSQTPGLWAGMIWRRPNNATYAKYSQKTQPSHSKSSWDAAFPVFLCQSSSFPETQINHSGTEVSKMLKTACRPHIDLSLHITQQAGGPRLAAHAYNTGQIVDLLNTTSWGQTLLWDCSGPLVSQPWDFASHLHRYKWPHRLHSSTVSPLGWTHGCCLMLQPWMRAWGSVLQAWLNLFLPIWIIPIEKTTGLKQLQQN